MKNMSLNGLAGLARLAPPAPHPSTDPGYLLSELPDWIRRLLGLPLEGQLLPKRPRGPAPTPPPGGASLQGRPKTIKPAFSPPGQGQPLVGHGPFKCGYCGRYGQPGACEGCGAPNAPAQGEALPPRRPDTILRMHEAVSADIVTPNEARAMCGMNPVPAFDMVKR